MKEFEDWYIKNIGLILISLIGIGLLGISLVLFWVSYQYIN